ncbi:MAG: glycosyltransferase family 2 protein [Anaerolineales bacterium]|nr:glycosyltransferase family 2 protein [Anaerolineales bacterium]
MIATRMSPAAPEPAPLPAAPAAVQVSVVMPCLNERATIGACVTRALEALAALGLPGEIIVADNGSTDGSVEIARGLGARVVHQPVRGYGAAYMKGIAAAQGEYIVMGDSDNTYDFMDLPRLIAPLQAGGDLAMGSRFLGKILPGAMPWANRYIGNPVLTGMLNVLFQTRISDAHSGLRAFTRAAYARMQLRTTGMEFASEMVIKASLARLKITEVPITYYPRGGTSKLSPLGDGWRHVRFMLLFSPAYLFLLPGLAAMLLGLLVTVVLVRGPFYLGSLYVGIHYMIVGSLLAVLGQQMVSFGLSARVFATSEHLVGRDRLVEAFQRYYNLERGLIIGGLLGGLGLALLVYILAQYLAGDVRFSELIHLHEAIAASTLMIMGVQLAAASFFLSLLELHLQTRADPLE